MRLALALKAVEAKAEKEGLAAADMGIDMGIVEEVMTEEEAVEEATAEETAGEVAEDRKVVVDAPGERCSDIIES
ncbi:MAG: hypothetical protein Q7J55_02320 [bacterium]|nr:hypothetical protein [bacterium]